MKLKYFILFPILYFVYGCSSDSPSYVMFKKIDVGVWKITVGKPERINLLSELDIHPKSNAINDLGEAELPLMLEDIQCKIIDGKTYICFPLEKDEKIYGLGLNFKTVEQRGRVMQLRRS